LQRGTALIASGKKLAVMKDARGIPQFELIVDFPHVPHHLLTRLAIAVRD